MQTFDSVFDCTLYGEPFGGELTTEELQPAFAHIFSIWQHLYRASRAQPDTIAYLCLHWCGDIQLNLVYFQIKRCDIQTLTAATTTTTTSVGTLASFDVCTQVFVSVVVTRPEDGNRIVKFGWRLLERRQPAPDDMPFYGLTALLRNFPDDSVTRVRALITASRLGDARAITAYSTRYRTAIFVDLAALKQGKEFDEHSAVIPDAGARARFEVLKRALPVVELSRSSMIFIVRHLDAELIALATQHNYRVFVGAEPSDLVSNVRHIIWCPFEGPATAVCHKPGCITDAASQYVDGQPYVQLGCGGCQTRFYCGQDCQRADWPEHKLICVCACTESFSCAGHASARARARA